MSVKWTEEQQKVIETRKRNLLVSAAAGSGKTAVLVERIITMITKDTPPINVDEILVVTFTEAAAAEMKERIGIALEKALEENPNNAHLKKQAVLIHTAKIMTIHSFCLSVIKEYFHTIDLDPGFRVAEEGELKLLKLDVMKELLEAKYEEESTEFIQFVESFATGRDDAKLEELILKIYEYAGAYPDAEAWLDTCCEAYKNVWAEESPFMERILFFAKQSIDDVSLSMEYAMELCEMDDGPGAYLKTIEADMKILSAIRSAKSYEEYWKAFQTLEKWPRLASNRDKNTDSIKAEQVKELRDGWKKKVSFIKEKYFFQSKEEQQKDLDICLPMIQMLTSLVKEFNKAFLAKKAEKNMIDFHDMEQFALQILTRKENGHFYPSEVAKDYQKQFVEVMIDEYQDSNLLQETILKSVSRMEKGENNIFMVGDVKQSIYRFRLSRPELFMEKYNTYSKEDSICQRIDLHKNFRSREEVLEATNTIFEKIMTKKLGGITYDADAALYVGAAYPDGTDNDTEIMLVDLEEKISADEAKKIEARAIAERIHKIIENQKVWDKKEEMLRPVTYGDIVILSRGLKGYTDVVKKVFAEEGIPVLAESQEGYFETLEISWILNYLRVLDNYRQDIPLAAVLKSPFGNCTNEELAEVRIAWENVSFHEAVLRTVGIWWKEEKPMKHDIPEATVRKLKNIFRQMEQFRSLVPYTSIQDLLWKIITETGYKHHISAMPGGEQRSANLDMLLVKAKTFENTSYKGLFHFVRYMDQMKKYELDTGVAGVFNEQMNAVRLMSIHKSKGLEFPVVIVAGMGKGFNTMDLKGSIVLHPELGIGIDAVDIHQRTKATTIIKNVIQTETKLENLGEELRVLYVALTRAKEKLILVGTVSEANAKMEKMSQVILEKNGTLTFSHLSAANSYFEWVLPAVLTEPNSKIGVDIVKMEDIVASEIEREENEQFDKVLYLKMIEENESLASGKYHIKEQLTYSYPFKAEQVKLKYSVSELKKRAMFEASEEEDGQRLVKESDEYVPSFISEEEALTGASRGSAYHKVMELLDFSKEYDEKRLNEEIIKWKKEGYINEEMAACIDVKDILQFLSTEAGKRMYQAAKKGKLFKEKPFVIGVDAKTIYPDSESEELVLVQGIIDVFWEEDGKLIALDYKTDKIWKARELIDKYKEQLDLYGRALQQMFDKSVEEKIIYSFTMKREIQL